MSAAHACFRGTDPYSFSVHHRGFEISWNFRYSFWWRRNWKARQHRMGSKGGQHWSFYSPIHTELSAWDITGGWSRLQPLVQPQYPLCVFRSPGIGFIGNGAPKLTGTFIQCPSLFSVVKWTACLAYGIQPSIYHNQGDICQTSRWTDNCLYWVF